MHSPSNGQVPARPVEPSPGTAESAGPVIDQRHFRNVLGSFPTGVAVLTAIDSNGEPTGMAIGSFVSVSLDPPLVGFFPTKDSRSFARMRTSSSFCVNILASHQESLCRAFASNASNKFDGVEWDPAPSGSPRLRGVAGWIDCDFEEIRAAGDHFSVLGRVRSLGSAEDELPLVFFQGGYGRFIPASLVAIPEPDVIGHLRQADLARNELEALATEFRAESLATAVVGDQLVVVAGAGVPSVGSPRTRVGQRSPLIPPLGTLVAANDESRLESWLARAGATNPELLDTYEHMVERVRDRGWSLILANDTQLELERLFDAYSGTDRDPDYSEQISRLGTAVHDQYEPAELSDDTPIPVRMISVPVSSRTGGVDFLLSVWGLPEPMTGRQINACVARLRQAAESIATTTRSTSRAHHSDH